MGGYSLSQVLNFCIEILSLILLFDIISKHRRNNSLALSFILIVLPIFIGSLLTFELDSSLKFNIYQFNKIIFIIGCLSLFNYLYFNSFKKYIYIVSFILFVLFITRCIYTFYYNINYIPDQNLYYNFEIQPYRYTGKLSIYFNIIRLSIVLLIIFWFFYLWRKKVFNSKNENLYYSKIKNFTNLVLIFIITLILLFCTKLFFKQLFSVKINLIIQFLLQLYILLLIFYRPQFLNKISASKLALIYKFNYLYDFVLDTQKFDQLFFIELAYIDNNFNINSFADQLNVNKEDLVIYINNRFGLTFDDLVNKNRIEYFVELIRKPNYQNFTIDALSKEVGFVSRNAFYKPFKKFHGGNPSDLIDLFS